MGSNLFTLPDMQYSIPYLNQLMILVLGLAVPVTSIVSFVNTRLGVGIGG